MKCPHGASQTDKWNIEPVPISILGIAPTIAQQKQQHSKCLAMSMKQGMFVQIEQRRRSKRQATIAQDATRGSSDDQVVVAPSNVLAAEHLNEPDVEGTIAHDYTWAPLVYTNWSKVSHKDEMWGNINEKYIIPSSVEKWVLQSIRDSWRVFKSHIKRDHYYKYDNDKARWENRLTRVLDSHFKVLLQYWNDSTVQKSKEGRSPSKTTMFEETRKRKEGCTYKHSNDDILDKIANYYWPSYTFLMLHST
ncbi:hypothetical protein Cgig2_008594 [Carnegiea gigantea]|uniref:Transposase n=1 Tax=Carnegiea gigantea TaxID=171969 RepID=A0A9Q1JV98_9CARY|nr:hypothetical protein Cgig2_008594 [Carnegiea gigantea]